MTEADILRIVLQICGFLALVLGGLHERRMRKLEEVSTAMGERLHNQELDLAKNYITEIALQRALDTALKPVNESLTKIIYWAERHNGGLPLGAPP